MATIASSRSNGDPRRKPYTLTVAPIDYSLTEGTNIPAPSPSPSPPRTPPEPPKALNGLAPLSSNPPESSASSLGTKTDGTPVKPAVAMQQSPLSTASGAHTAPNTSPLARQRGPSIRRLFSLNSLRSSFGSSRSSLLLPSHGGANDYSGSNRPSSSGLDSIMAPSMTSTMQPPSQRRRRRSSIGWFSRRSFAEDERNEEDDQDLGERLAKRRKEYVPPPTLPEINELGGGDMQNGSLGWNDGWFNK